MTLWAGSRDSRIDNQQAHYATLTRAEPRVSAAKKLGRFSLRDCKSAFEPRAPQSLQVTQGNSLSG